MAITDKLTTIKDYFLDWHERYYNALHKKTIEDLETETENRIQGDENLQNNIDRIFPTSSDNIINQNKTNERVTTTLNRLDRPASIGNLSWNYDGDGRGTYINVGGPRENGYMTWTDKARLISMGQWYQITGRGVTKYMTFWFNPALRLCQLNFVYDGCKLLKNSNSYVYTPNDPMWYEMRPLAVTGTWCSGGGSNPIFMYVNSVGKFGLYSATKHSSANIHGSVMWFYRDQNLPDYKFSPV